MNTTMNTNNYVFKSRRYLTESLHMAENKLLTLNHQRIYRQNGEFTHAQREIYNQTQKDINEMKEALMKLDNIHTSVKGYPPYEQYSG